MELRSCALRPSARSLLTNRLSKSGPADSLQKIASCWKMLKDKNEITIVCIKYYWESKMKNGNYIEEDANR